jgi:hypothetical protein
MKNVPQQTTRVSNLPEAIRTPVVALVRVAARH